MGTESFGGAPKSGWDNIDTVSQTSIDEADKILAQAKNEYKIAPHYEVKPTPSEPVPTGIGPTEFMHTDEGRSEVITEILQSTEKENAPRIIRSDGEPVKEIAKFQNTVPVSEFQISEAPIENVGSINVGRHAFTPTMSPEQRRQQRAAQAAKPEEKGFFKRLFGG